MRFTGLLTLLALASISNVSAQSTPTPLSQADKDLAQKGVLTAELPAGQAVQNIVQQVKGSIIQTVQKGASITITDLSAVTFALSDHVSNANSELVPGTLLIVKIKATSSNGNEPVCFDLNLEGPPKTQGQREMQLKVGSIIVGGDVTCKSPLNRPRVKVVQPENQGEQNKMSQLRLQRDLSLADMQVALEDVSVEKLEL